MATDPYARIVSPASERITSVRNWNAAARRATGRHLFVIADDLLPPPHWDTALARIIGDLDPLTVPYVVKIGDQPDDPRPELLRHPVISRNFYKRFGLFDPVFDGLCCDDDLTFRAFRNAFVLDATSVPFEHHNPFISPDVVPTESQRRMNTEARYREAKRLLLSRWSPLERRVDFRFFPPGRRPGRTTRLTWTLRRRLRGKARAARTELIGRIRARLTTR